MKICKYNLLFNCRKFFLSLLKRQNYLKGNKNCSSHVFDADNAYATSTATTKHFCVTSARGQAPKLLKHHPGTKSFKNRNGIHYVIWECSQEYFQPKIGKTIQVKICSYKRSTTSSSRKISFISQTFTWFMSKQIDINTTCIYNVKKFTPSATSIIYMHFITRLREIQYEHTGTKEIHNYTSIILFVGQWYTPLTSICTLKL